MEPKYQIAIIVDGGNVQSAYTTLLADTDIEVEILDFDNARADGDDPDALDKMKARLAVAETELRQIF
jgi:hypothetical protein